MRLEHHRRAACLRSIGKGGRAVSLQRPLNLGSRLIDRYRGAFSVDHLGLQPRAMVVSASMRSGTSPPRSRSMVSISMPTRVTPR